LSSSWQEADISARAAARLLSRFATLLGLHRTGRARFSQIHTVNLDEFVGLSFTDPRSFRGFMQRHLFRHINVPPDRVHFLAGDARDTERECARFESLIARAALIWKTSVVSIACHVHPAANPLHARLAHA
jgi:6-phosphogluconolactonase/glucosamine-6-phosphate isomerase/deaminase